MRNARRRPVVVVALAGALVLAALMGIGSASAVDYSLPSLWQAYQDDFTIGTFGGWNSQQALYHYRSNALPNQLKLDSQVGTSSNNSLSRQAYVAAVTQINADSTLTPEAKAAAIEQANQHIVLQPTTGSGQAENILQAIEAYNATNHLSERDKKIVRGHVFAWHGGQQPNWFFCDGFIYDSANPDWASPDTMLHRLDNYIHAMVDKYAKYSDIIVSWDVVNEALDDYSGQVRNGTDYQVSQWGRIFRRPDLDGTPDARLYAESAWIRQAFQSARTWSNAAGVHWKLYYNDFQDSDKLYEPKMSQTIKMLRPIHDAGNIDGYGMQGRLAWAYPSIAQLRAQINAGLTVADEISISESDIRSDFEPNPDYDPTQPTRRVTAADGNDPAHQWPVYGSCSWNLVGQANGNTFDVCNSPVRRIQAWGPGPNDALANSADIMKKQADFAADWFDLLLSYRGKIKIYDFDGTSDMATFNSTTGGHLWSGEPGNAEKYSFFAVLGAPAREKMRDAIAQADALDPHQFTDESWQRVADARAAAASLVDVRIYAIDGVNNVKNATSALLDAIAHLERIVVTCFEDDDSHLAYEPGWHTVSDADASAGHLRLSNGKKGMSFSFSTAADQGTVQYFYASSTKGGSADVYLDGQRVNSVSYRGNAGSLNAPTIGASTTLSFSRSGAHTFALRNANGPVYVDRLCVTEGSSSAQPSSGPGQTSAQTNALSAGSSLTDVISVPANATSLSLLAESNAPVPYKLVLLDPSGRVLGSASSTSNGIASLDAPVSSGGRFVLKLVDLGAGPVSVWSAATPQVTR